MDRKLRLKIGLQAQLMDITTDVRTFGEFKSLPQVQELSIDWGQNKLIDRETKNSFDIDEAILPAIESILFVVPSKTKSGGLSYAEAKKKILQLIEEGKMEKISWMGKSTEDLNKLLQEQNFETTTINSVVDNSDCNVGESSDLLEEIDQLLNKLGSKVKQLSMQRGDNSNSVAIELEKFKQTLVSYVTADELTLEAEMLQLKFK